MSFVLSTTRNLRGVDINNAMGPMQSKAFVDRGYQFVIRYIGRLQERFNDLTAPEVETIHAAGLGLMIVQHVENESAWVPTPEKGVAYGRHAAEACTKMGIPMGTTVWLDLEGVSGTVPSSVVALYCKAWHAAVKLAGYQPGLYVGWHCGLSPSQLYYWLPFEIYWGAYNLNRDEEPYICGVAMKQNESAKDVFCQNNPHDTNAIMGDRLGRLPHIFVPSSWQIAVSQGTANPVK